MAEITVIPTGAPTLEVGDRFTIVPRDDEPEWFRTLYSGKMFEVVKVEIGSMRIKLVQEQKAISRA